MYCKLYLDIFFVQQAVLNLYMLALVGKVMKCTATHFRIFLGALLGAFITCIILLLPMKTLYGRLLLGAIPSGVCMLRMTFGIRGRALLRGCMSAGGCSFFLNSIVLWIMNRFRGILNAGEELMLILLGGCAAYFVLYGSFRFLQSRLNREIYTVAIPLPGQESVLRLKGFVDTGNCLTEPISARPVCLISREAAQGLTAYFCPEKYHAIPYQSIGKSRGILDAYELPVLYLEEETQNSKKESVIVAICSEGIRKEDFCQMILHPGLIDD